ncbi:MAG: hypothetical protein QF645_04785 [Planctomycetota bacterium]|nr:hypothetical protein [Planctomycetota bacterium]
MATFCASLFEFCSEEELEDEDWLEEELLPLLLLEEFEEEVEPWLEDELEGVLPELLLPDDEPEIAAATTRMGVATYLKNRRHINILL